MSFLARIRPVLAIIPKSLRISAVLLLLAFTLHTRQIAAQTTPQNASNSCAKFGDAFQDSNDLVTLQAYRSTISGLLDSEDFKQLDCIADSVRSNKTRFAGGFWQLRSFYRGVSEVQGHATEEDWRTRIEHLQKWSTANPTSITARVALAEAYTSYAWHARGDGMGDTVTDNGWKLFGQRIDQARMTLEDASSLPSRCPEWYSAMLLVARAQGWDIDKVTELLKKAAAFAPDYYYNYRSLAVYMLPKWEGQDGDASRFAEDSANRVGGAQGDILYFQIATGIVCACDEPEFIRMSWPRLQKGYEALEKQYGASVSMLNTFALMATKNGDSVAADAVFKRIGDNFDKEEWVTQDFFNQMKTWASQFAPHEDRSRKIKQEAEANALSPTGPQYQTKVEQALAKILQECAKGADDRSQFELMLQVGGDGIAKDAWMPHPTGVGNCVLKNVYDSSVKKKALFKRPPHTDYWIKLALDPGVSVATK
jgi:hypothetical protein